MEIELVSHLCTRFPDHPQLKLGPGDDATEHFRRQPGPLCFVGHTHVPFVFIRMGDRIVEAPFEPFRLSPSDAVQVALNPGGVGQPRDEDPRAAYALHDPDTGVLKRDGVESKMNPYDLYALETALRIGQSLGASITALTMGPPQAEAVLREAFMMGVDEGVLLSDRRFGGAETT